MLFVRKFVEKAHESSFPLGNEIQVAQVIGGPRGTKWGTTCISSGPKATDNRGISVCTWASRNIVFRVFAHPGPSINCLFHVPRTQKSGTLGLATLHWRFPYGSANTKTRQQKKIFVFQGYLTNTEIQ